jgi:hypothetical protein
LGTFRRAWTWAGFQESLRKNPSMACGFQKIKMQKF